MPARWIITSGLKSLNPVFGFTSWSENEFRGEPVSKEDLEYLTNLICRVELTSQERSAEFERDLKRLRKMCGNLVYTQKLKIK